jgi:molybdenum cofactor sulfurtransferase
MDFDALREREYSRLDRGGHVYLDYTGAGLHAESQLLEHARLLAGEVLGNPHSANLTSSATTALVERTRRAVLAYFNASPDEYTAIFTLNASAALKLVAESFPFRPGGRALLTVDNHNSVNGLREFAIAKGATVDYAPLTFPELRFDAPTSRACSIRSRSSPRHAPPAGMCCSMRPRSCRPTDSIYRW